MYWIFCIDDQDGLQFNNRRQSRDVAVVSDIICMAGGKRIWMSSYSAELFKGLTDTSIIAEYPEDNAYQEEYCFLERMPEVFDCDSIQGVVLYRWNRKYPADRKLDRSILSKMHITQVTEFAGNSHEKITKEIYLL